MSDSELCPAFIIINSVVPMIIVLPVSLRTPISFAYLLLQHIRVAAGCGGTKQTNVQVYRVTLASTVLQLGLSTIARALALVDIDCKRASSSGECVPVVNRVGARIETKRYPTARDKPNQHTTHYINCTHIRTVICMHQQTGERQTTRSPIQPSRTFLHA
jgi:hypothetical protein